MYSMAWKEMWSFDGVMPTFHAGCACLDNQHLKFCLLPELGYQYLIQVKIYIHKPGHHYL